MLTDLQQRTLEEIESYIDTNHYAPTHKELADLMGVTSNAIYERLAAMRKKGVVDWKDGQARTLHIIKG